MRLHGYFRSSASWRVRIALRYKGWTVEQTSYQLRRQEQRLAGYLRLNPQGLVPTLELDNGTHLTQSFAICEYLEEVRPAPPLLPADPVLRAKVRAFALVIACDVHPLQNLKILARLRQLGLDEEAVTGWARKTIEEGLDACEALAGEGPFCFGDTPTLADVFLVPQLANGRRFGVEPRWPRLLEAERASLALEAFAAAAPGNQPDAEP